MSTSSVDPFRQAFADAAAELQRGQVPPAPPPSVNEDPFHQIFREAMQAQSSASPAHRRTVTVQEQMNSPIVATVEEEAAGPEVDEAADLLDGLDLDEAPSRTFRPARILFPSSPARPAIRHRELPAESFGDRLERVIGSSILPSHSRQISRAMPTKNPLADELFLARTQNSRLSLSPASAKLSRAVFGFDDIDSYSMFGPHGQGRQPYKVPKVSFHLEPSKRKNSQMGAQYDLEADQDNYYYHLLAATPEDSPRDFLAATVGQNVVLRKNRSGEISVLAHDGLSYKKRDLHPTSVAFSQSSRSLLVGTKDNLLEMWRIEDDGSAKLRLSIGIPGEVQSVAFACGRILAGTQSGELYEIDPKDGAIVRCRKLGTTNVYQIAVSPDGNRVAVVAQKEKNDDTLTTIYLLAPKVEKSEKESAFVSKKTFYAEQPRGVKLAFSPDGRYLAAGTGNEDGKLILMEVGRHGSSEERAVKIASAAKDSYKVDEKGRLIFEVLGYDDEDRPVGFQAASLQWIEDRGNDVIIATLNNGSVVFVPIDREKLRVGAPLNTSVHSASRVTYSAYRKGELYTAAPTEVCPYARNQRGMIRTTNLVQNR